MISSEKMEQATPVKRCLGNHKRLGHGFRCYNRPTLTWNSKQQIYLVKKSPDQEFSRMDKKMVKLTADTKVLQFLAKSGELVSKLPDWKIGVL